MSIAAKLGKAAMAIGAIAKKAAPGGGVKYQYQHWDDVVPAVRDSLAEVGLWITESATLLEYSGVGESSGGNLKYRAVVNIEITILDTESADKLTINWIGESIGTDDKTVQKAITSGVKYALLKLLLIPIVDTTDTDAYQGEESKTGRPVTVTLSDAEKAKIDAAAAHFKKMDGTKEQWKQLDAACKAKGVKSVEVVIDAVQENGVTTLEALHEFASGIGIKHPFTLGNVN